MDRLEVQIDMWDSISVFNNGDGIPVEMHKQEHIFVPELIFGHLLTTGGRNGYGSKLTNIFSTEFVNEIADGKRQLKYKQIFSREPNLPICTFVSDQYKCRVASESPFVEELCNATASVDVSTAHDSQALQITPQAHNL